MTAPGAEQLLVRRPVWQALSDLYLDTDVDALHARVARVLAQSPYSLDVLWRILRDEVHPALRYNLSGVAGEWAGFDPGWLADRIVRRLARPRWRRPFGCLFCGYPRQQWRILAPLIQRERGAG
ncbi:DUF7079 family protein [Pseudoxanthomonas wuyuanensis]|uniref:DUF7079 domain-containing protein n=1 Tax=Pseudoxanthomonas wuyuanensis TaxID=1073196 RepID=A0A286D8N1_9GAMM|nr:hypothetical protein [Pseudoxanthomonas wuyuanensis]SOD54994.1 hypothetical protein SAMN06296416_105267 [Pseudoxanthomonas wuyuanensis]